MASLAEIFDTTELRYAIEITAATTAADSGLGPPFSLTGWVRTGVSSITNTVPGNANCSVWTSNSNTGNGTTVALNPQ